MQPVIATLKISKRAPCWSFISVRTDHIHVLAYFKARLDGASFRGPAQATLHALLHASWRKSRASLAACLFLFRRHREARAECL